MSFSVGVIATADDAVDKIDKKFAEFYPDPAQGVVELIEIGLGTVNDFFSSVKNDDGANYSIGISGHAQQGETDHDSLTVSINYTTATSA